MTTNEIVGRLKAGGLDASSTNRGAAVYVTEARAGRAEPGWFGFRIVCDSEATERRVRAILSRWYDIDVSGNVWRLRAKNRVQLMAIKRGGVPPTPPTPTTDYMYFEAVEPNSTVSMMSTLATAPNLEYSTDGENFQEWKHTTQTEDDMSMHVFDTITLGNVGDRVHLRGINPSGLSVSMDEGQISVFAIDGKMKSGGSITSLLDGDGVSATSIPNYGLLGLFGGMMTGQPNQLLTAPSFGNVETLGDFACMYMFAFCEYLTTPADMSEIKNLGDGACYFMYMVCVSLESASSMPKLENVGDNCFAGMYKLCTFAMSSNGTDLNFGFKNAPFTSGGITFDTDEDIAIEMENKLGFGYTLALISFDAYTGHHIVFGGVQNDDYTTFPLLNSEHSALDDIWLSLQSPATVQMSANYTITGWRIWNGSEWVDYSSDNPTDVAIEPDKAYIFEAVS